MSSTGQIATPVKKVAIQEFVKFIFEQNPHRPTKLVECRSTYNIGCPMVHFGKEILKISQPFACGDYTWALLNTSQAIYECIGKTPTVILGIAFNSPHQMITYGDLQQYILQTFPSQIYFKSMAVWYKPQTWLREQLFVTDNW